jgi:polar amino acid transport system permease protein
MLDPEIFIRYGGRLFDAFLVTLRLTVLACIAGFLIALLMTSAQMSGSRILRRVVSGYVFFFRGTPLLAQAFLIYFGAGQFRAWLEPAGLWFLFRDAYWCGLIAISLNTGSYTTVLLGGAVQAVPRGIVDACLALGMSRLQMFRLVLLPLAFRLAMPAYGNEVILTLKGTAVLSVISVNELMAQTRLVFSRTFALEIFLVTGAAYLLTTILFQRAWRALAHHLNVQEESETASKIRGEMLH